MTTRKPIKQISPLLVEPHPAHYTGYQFITLVQFCQDHILCIIDNSNDKEITAYVLDLCNQNDIDEERVIDIATDWYNNSRTKHPISIEFAKHGMMEAVSAIYRDFNVEFVTRVIGPLPTFDMGDNVQIRKRRKRAVPKSVELKVYSRPI